MKNIIIFLLGLISSEAYAQFLFPPTSPIVTYTKNITIDGDQMVPVAIATHLNKSTGVEKVATSYYKFGFAHKAAFEVYNSLSNFESGAIPSSTIYQVSAGDFLTGIEALAYDKTNAGNLFVMETEKAAGSRLAIFDSINALITTYQSSEIFTAIGGGFNNARGIAFDNSNNVYIADDGNNRIVKITSPIVKSSSSIGEFIKLPIGSNPKAVCIQGDFIYIACWTSMSIRKYNINTGAFIDSVLTAPYSPIDLSVKTDGNHIYCSQIDIGGVGNGYIKAYDYALVLKQTYTDVGNTAGPWGTSVSSKGDLYCSDGTNNRFVKYKRTRLIDKDILTYTIPTQIGSSSINSANGTIAITMPTTSVLTSLIPSFTSSPLSFISKTTGVADNFSAPVSMMVTADDGSTKNWTVNISKATASIENTKTTNLYCYPNPIIDKLMISYDKKIATIEIYDITGNVVSKINCKKLFNIELNTQDWTPGIYMLKSIDESGFSTIQKIIK